MPTLDNVVVFLFDRRSEYDQTCIYIYITQSLLNCQLTLGFSNIKWVLKCSLVVNP